MVRLLAFTIAVGFAAFVPQVAPFAAEADTATWTGWFSDMGCAAPRVEKGLIGPNNSDCVLRCLDRGAKAVFISEQAKAVFEIKDHPSVKDDVGFYVELTGVVDEKAKTISVKTVKRLSEVVASCARPNKVK